MRTVETALTGDVELSLSCLWRAVAMGKASYSGLGTGKFQEDTVVLLGVRKGI